ncbi:DDE family transposase [Nonlabens xylanidelens]|uniref:DDE family transposase n=1 Tax=Nonlabens xylanidelens TaxID=191564 RepID=A0A2S6IFT5_9FLAO|nr:DDE family transposase [Nonlabens xylanidelens]
MNRVILRKRAVIESINDVLKNTCYIEHSRHRSFDNFIANLVTGLTTYSFLESKPFINIQRFLPEVRIP